MAAVSRGCVRSQPDGRDQDELSLKRPNASCRPDSGPCKATFHADWLLRRLRSHGAQKGAHAPTNFIAFIVFAKPRMLIKRLRL